MSHTINISLYTPVLWLTLGALIGLPWGYFAAWITDPSHVWMRVLGTLVMIQLTVHDIDNLTKEFRNASK